MLVNQIDPKIPETYPRPSSTWGSSPKTLMNRTSACSNTVKITFDTPKTILRANNGHVILLFHVNMTTKVL